MVVIPGSSAAWLPALGRPGCYGSWFEQKGAERPGALPDPVGGGGLRSPPRRFDRHDAHTPHDQANRASTTVPRDDVLVGSTAGFYRDQPVLGRAKGRRERQRLAVVFMQNLLAVD